MALSEQEIVTLKEKAKNIKLPRNHLILVILFIAPAFIHLAIFWFGSQVEALIQGFTDMEGNFSGFENYKYLFECLSSGEGDLMLAFGNTFKYFFMGMLMIPVGIFTAYMFYKKMPGHMFVRVVLFIPGTVAGLMYLFAYKYLISDYGPLIPFLRNTLGFQIQEDPLSTIGLPMVMIFDVWMGICGNMIIWLGAMCRIPNEIVEYAIFDGATPVQEFRHITLPLIWPTVVTVTMLSLMGIFGASGSILAMTEGQYGTTTFAYWSYRVMYANSQYGSYEHKVVAVGHEIMIATLPIVFGGRWIMNKFGSEEQY